jgi:hypothetical protein
MKLGKSTFASALRQTRPVQSFPPFWALNQVALFKSESRCFMESDLYSYRLKETLCKRCGLACVAADPADVGNTGIVEVWVQCPSCGDSWKIRFHKKEPSLAIIADRKIGRANRWRRRRQRPTLFFGPQEQHDSQQSPPQPDVRVRALPHEAGQFRTQGPEASGG